MTAPPAGALEACLALLEKAKLGQLSVSGAGFLLEDRHMFGDGVYGEAAPAIAAAVNLLKDHGPALLAALRLRDGCEARIRAWRAGGPGLIDQQHVIYDYCADDLARVLEEGE